MGLSLGLTAAWEFELNVFWGVLLVELSSFAEEVRLNTSGKIIVIITPFDLRPPCALEAGRVCVVVAGVNSFLNVNYARFVYGIVSVLNLVSVLQAV